MLSEVPVRNRAHIAAANPNGTMAIITNAEVTPSNWATSTKKTISIAKP